MLELSPLLTALHSAFSPSIMPERSHAVPDQPTLHLCNLQNPFVMSNNINYALYVRELSAKEVYAGNII
jgi:hypothetical protein